MTTVIAVYNSDGCVGRCDARCHGAKSAKCDCICGGKNHGVGHKQAENNTADMIGLTEEDLERFRAAHGRQNEKMTVVNRLTTPSNRKARQQARDRLKQMELFS